MTNDIKVGEYLRLDNGYIYKWESNDYEWIYEEEGKFVYGNGANEYEWESDIVNHSFNIIDLIEAGDYVNGYKITTIGSNGIYAEDENGYLIKMFTKEDIKSIVTKEQFESMKYKI